MTGCEVCQDLLLMKKNSKSNFDMFCNPVLGYLMSAKGVSTRFKGLIFEVWSFMDIVWSCTYIERFQRTHKNILSLVNYSK